MAQTGLRIRHKKTIAGLTQELATMVLATSTEVARATGAENDLSDALAAEVARATGVEGPLGDLVTEDKSNLITAINELHQNAAEAGDATQADIDALNAALAQEVTDRTDGDSALQTQIDDLAAGSESDVSDLEDALEAEITRATDAEAVNADNISTEVDTRISEITRVEGLINQEVEDRTNEDVALDARLDTIESGMLAGTLWKDSFENVSDLDTLVEEDLQDGWAYSITSQNDGYVYISTSAGDYQPEGWTGGFVKFADFTEISGLVNDEKARAIAAEGVLTTDLANEISARTDADTVLTDNLNLEITNRTDADTVLTDNLNLEITNRTDADADLQAQIDDLAAGSSSKDDEQDARLDIIEGDSSVDGSIAKAQADAQTYADDTKLAKTANLSDVSDVQAARDNLDIMSTSEINDAIILGGSIPINDRVTVDSDKITLTEAPKNGVIFGGTIDVEYEEDGYDVVDRVTVQADPDDETGKVFIVNVSETGEYDGNEATCTYLFVDSDSLESDSDGETV